MKKGTVGILLMVIAGIFAIMSCKSAPEPAPQAAAPARAAPVEEIEVAPSDDIIVDWRGRSAGAARPAWLLPAIEDDYYELENLPRLRGKKPVILHRDGANLPVLEAWVNTQAYTECGQRIRTAVETAAQNATEGDLASGDAITLVRQFSSLYSQATITGFGKEMESWIKTRSRATGREKYSYYVIFSIADDALESSIAETFGRVEAKTRQQADIKAKLEDQMVRLIDKAKF
jgi:hypothetical protein